jgi:hypothetical protein
MELFDLPPQPAQRLDAATHAAVFGGLPTTLAADLHTPAVGDLVLQLLDLGWRAGQLAARAGALPASADPVAAVEELLAGFLLQVPPDARWREEKAQREAPPWAQAALEQPACDASREQWIQQIRTGLGQSRGQRREPVRRVKPPCALCGAESSFFVTKQVRLCDGCVVLLSTGAVRLSDVS